jgi:enamine deaminase RidA (YjgF/YER057c/UK114 family)
MVQETGFQRICDTLVRLTVPTFVTISLFCVASASVAETPDVGGEMATPIPAQSTLTNSPSGTTVAAVGSADSNPASGAPAAQSTKKQTETTGNQKTLFPVHHEGPWEQQIGYSQAVVAGRTIYISGTTGADEKGFPPEMESQMKLAYAAIQRTMSHYGADFSNIVMERIYTTDLEALIKCQEERKKIYGDWLPAATWVEVKRLYEPKAKIEIEVELVLK